MSKKQKNRRILRCDINVVLKNGNKICGSLIVFYRVKAKEGQLMATMIIQASAHDKKVMSASRDKVFLRLQEILLPRIYGRVERYLLKREGDFGEVEEIRLRGDKNVYLTLGRGGRKQNFGLDCHVSSEEMSQIFDRMCDGSLYTYSESIIKGYISVGEGIRVGVCGRASVENGRILGVYNVSALNIRLPRAPMQLTRGLYEPIRECIGRGEGALIYSPPAQGKTTVLRSLCYMLSSGDDAMRVSLVDSRDELGTFTESRSCSVDVLSGYPKAEAIYMATAFMNPQIIICDEIGSDEEAMAIASAQNCGVPLIASAHGESITSILRRPSILSLHNICAFGIYAGIRIADGGAFAYTFHSREEACRILEDNRTSGSSS